MSNFSERIETRVQELDANLDLSSSDIFNTVCNENNLSTVLITQELGCECPFALIGFVNELEQSEISFFLAKFSNILSD
ncbi:hypothetical protein A6770_33025 [Nostoc minutum NIES-26]|uniref:Uncharacterized protein n=1 Tax=Nostoc minutum NIES-26 TaxID=1844469 RepID=A0A367Q3T5_9NOSO|nr:hypothetical protein A6770_33025 [Nostoc minutum NIES-26]